MTGHMTAGDLGIDLTEGAADQLFRWFLASLLFGRPIQQDVAANTYRVLIKHGLTSPGQFEKYDREGLRALLDEGHYARLDYIMTDELHDVMRTVKDEYGSVSQMVKKAESRKALTDKLVALKGVGPKTAEIFLRDIPKSVLSLTNSLAPETGIVGDEREGDHGHPSSLDR